MRAFRVTKDPFPGSGDREYYFSTPALAARLAELCEAIERGHVLLIDERGSGKSTMLESFAEAALEQLRIFPLRIRGQRDAKTFTNDLVSTFGLPRREPVAAELRDADTLLELLTTRSRRAVIVIDDAHRLENDALEQLGYLARRWERFNLRFLVSAEPGFAERLTPARGAAPLPGTVTTLEMPRFDAEQVSDYLHLCLFRAGLVGDSPFDEDLVAKVTQEARGLVGAIDPIARALLDEARSEMPGQREGEGANATRRRWPVALVAAAGLGTLLTVALPDASTSRDTLQTRTQSEEFRTRITPAPRGRFGNRRGRSAAAPP